MFVLVVISLIAGTVSLVWGLAALFSRVRARLAWRRARERERSERTREGRPFDASRWQSGGAYASPKLLSTIVKRTLLMALIWLTFAALIHLGITRWPAFAHGLPVSVLKWDIGNRWYSEHVLAELRQRVGGAGMSAETIREVTDAVLDAYADEPAQLGFGTSPLPGPSQWMDLAQRSTLITPDQMQRWLAIAPPPVFRLRPVLGGALFDAGRPEIGNRPREGATASEILEGAAPVAATSPPPPLPSAAMPEPPAAVVDVVYGRIWGREQSVPYEIAAIRIAEVRLDGQPAEFTFEELEDSRAALGRFADRVHLRLRIRPEDPSAHASSSVESAPPSGDGRGASPVAWETLEIRWEADVEPGGYRNLSPLLVRITPNGTVRGVVAETEDKK